MKKILLIASAIVIIAIIAGISFYNNLQEPMGIIQTKIDSYDLENAFSLVSKNNYAMFCTMNPNSSNEDCVNLVLINLKNGKVKSKTEITDLDFVDGCEFGVDNTIIVTDSENKKSAKYDMNMKLIEITDYFAEDYSVNTKKSPFYDDTTYIATDHSTYTSDFGAKFTYFYDDLDTVYLQNDQNKIDVAYYEKIVLNEKKNVGGDRIIEYCVDDYENSSTLSTQQIECENNYSIFDFLSCIGDKYVFLIVFELDEKNDKYQYEGFSWNYINDKQNINNGIKKYSINGIKDLNKSIINNLADEYKLNIKINNPNSAIASRVNCKGDYNEIKVNNILISLQDFIKKLPKGMITEIYSGYNYFNIKYLDIRIDIVNEINNKNTAAFAESTGEEMQICFSINKFDCTHVPHEFMHLIDTRIEDYLGEDNLFDYWINNTEQDYISDNTDNTDQFITEYATTNQIEDRAELFKFLFITADADEMPSELKNKGINKKVKILCELIRNSFPSVKKSNSVYWEKYVSLSFKSSLIY